jgi:hypothetical protein
VKLRTIAAVVVAVAALLVGSHVGNAQSGKKVLTATGQESCTTAEPGQWFTEPSGNVKIRGMISSCNDFGFVGPAAPFVTGTSNITVNCNLDASWAGQCWGTFGRPIRKDDVAWEGVWQGTINFATGGEDLKITGHGRGGPLEGLMLEEQTTSPGGAVLPTVSVRVFNPKGW